MTGRADTCGIAALGGHRLSGCVCGARRTCLAAGSGRPFCGGCSRALVRGCGGGRCLAGSRRRRFISGCRRAFVRGRGCVVVCWRVLLSWSCSGGRAIVRGRHTAPVIGRGSGRGGAVVGRRRAARVIRGGRRSAMIGRSRTGRMPGGGRAAASATRMRSAGADECAAGAGAECVAGAGALGFLLWPHATLGTVMRLRIKSHLATMVEMGWVNFIVTLLWMRYIVCDSTAKDVRSVRLVRGLPRLNFVPLARCKSARLDAVISTQQLLQGLCRHDLEGLRSATRIIRWLHVISAPDRPAAALHIALRKSVRKTVTRGKDCRFSRCFASARPMKSSAHFCSERLGSRSR